MQKRIVVDASVIVEILAGSRLVESLARDIAEGRVEAVAARLSLTEALYVLCRLVGWKTALERMSLLLSSRVMNIVEDEEVWELAADCKCRFRIALGDCYTLATAKLYGAIPLFLHPEKELRPILHRVAEWVGAKPAFVIGANVRDSS